MSDRGGGIARSVSELLFKYMYSTAPRPSKSDSHTVPLAGELYILLEKLLIFDRSGYNENKEKYTKIGDLY